MTTKPLIPYMRKSSGEDPEGSRDRQRRAIVAWAKTNGVQLAAEVWEQHVSGSKTWRERGLGEAIEACERGDASGIVVEEQSRLSRENGLATAEVWVALEKAGARLVCTAEGLDTKSGDQELNFGIRAVLARDQWKQYARRAEAAKRSAVEEKGLHIGPAPFGYVRQPHEPLAIDVEKADAVRAAFELRATGASYGDVIRLLDELAPGGPSGRGAWNRGTVTRLLSNRCYLGEARGGAGYVRPGAHPEIVSPETFATVQALARFGNDEPRQHVGARSLLAGIARCGSCGYALDRNKVAKHYLVYRCRGRSAKGVCEAPTSAMADKLEALVEDAVRERLSAGPAFAVQFEQADDADVLKLQKRLAATRAKRAPFEDPDYVAALGRDAALRALAKVNEEVAVIEEELAEALSQGGPSAVEAIGPTTAVALLDELRDTYDLDDPVARALYVKQMRDVLAAFVDSVLVRRGETRSAPLASRVEIVWRGDGAPLARPSRGRKQV